MSNCNEWITDPLRIGYHITILIIGNHLYRLGASMRNQLALKIIQLVSAVFLCPEFQSEGLVRIANVKSSKIVARIRAPGHSSQCLLQFVGGILRWQFYKPVLVVAIVEGRLSNVFGCTVCGQKTQWILLDNTVENTVFLIWGIAWSAYYI